MTCGLWVRDGIDDRLHGPEKFDMCDNLGQRFSKGAISPPWGAMRAFRGPMGAFGGIGGIESFKMPYKTMLWVHFIYFRRIVLYHNALAYWL